ncbi:peptide chain release factor N(5)-glutamine methyltransferase [Flavobacteriaceae bacterium F89]|uniref:Release factor glutamine methyltransferase n=1 Tax=Cerina litoralis TaxID=2874477 RepID=A0AAE3JR97_9FLAO|nr:peptide chain release factor N(5)-glutamine methyltransferase [Cerina litoralis]MCG2461098.1 peptide chain release factor N(5)-glutamine methyltransferase [Cerina litoralis]
MHLKEIKNIFHKELDSRYPKEEVDSFFAMMMEHYLGLDRFALALKPNLIVTKEEEQPFFEGITELRLERPIQYILGKAHFMGMDLLVNENVLIPRPETEELVRWILSEPRTKNQEPRILDIGTGSGCIAIALAKNLPRAKVYALDISKEALEVAKKNAARNEVEVNFVKADILKIDTIHEKFDIIVSNPPYVRELEKGEINNNVKRYEPELALFVSDRDPLIFYKRIVQFSLGSLRKEGLLFFEVNQYLATETRRLLENPNFSEIELRKDLYGNDRILKGKST